MRSTLDEIMDGILATRPGDTVTLFGVPLQRCGAPAEKPRERRAYTVRCAVSFTSMLHPSNEFELFVLADDIQGATEKAADFLARSYQPPYVVKDITVLMVALKDTVIA